MDCSTRQRLLAEVWNAQGIEALLRLMLRTPFARDHHLIQELHRQSLECEQTAPHVSVQLHRVAGQLTEIHAGLRAAECIVDLRDWLRWETEVGWRASPELDRLLNAIALQPEATGEWPWHLTRLRGLKAQLDDLVGVVGEQVRRAPAERLRGLQAEPRLQWPELAAWLKSKARAGGPQASEYAQFAEHASTWLHLTPTAGGPDVDSVLAEVIEPWPSGTSSFESIGRSLVQQVVQGQCSIDEALSSIVAESSHEMAHGKAYVLGCLSDEVSVSIRRAALMRYTALITSADVSQLERFARASLVRRWLELLDVHWSVIPEPMLAMEVGLRVVDHTLPSVVDGVNPRLAYSLMMARARLLLRFADWRDGDVDEAIRSYEMALEMSGPPIEPAMRGRAIAELAGLRWALRSDNPEHADRTIRELYDESLRLLRGTVVLRARVLRDFAVYLSRSIRPRDNDRDHALELARQAVLSVAGLSGVVRRHPAIRADEASHRLTLGNLWLEIGSVSLCLRRERASQEYELALECLGESDELRTGLIHLNRACIALALASRKERSVQLTQAHLALDQAIERLVPLPVPYARAVAERAMLAVDANPGDPELIEQHIDWVQGALHRLPLRAERVVRGRVERQLAALYLQRGGPGDRERAATHFAAARVALVDGGAARLAVEAARDYAWTQLGEHQDRADRAGLVRGAMVLKQSVLLAEQRWSSRGVGEPRLELEAMLEGVYSDLAWFQACLREAPAAVLHTVTRAKSHRWEPAMAAWSQRAERSSMLNPAYFEPLARRRPLVRSGGEDPKRPHRSASVLQTRIQSFIDANPSTIALDITLTGRGTIVVIAEPHGLHYVTIPLSNDTLHRWVQGDRREVGWWSHYRAYGQARTGSDPQTVERCERAWNDAGQRLAQRLGDHLVEPALAGLGSSVDDRIVVVALGHWSGLPLEAAVYQGQAFALRTRGLAYCASLAELPAGPMPDPRPTRALCVLSDASVSVETMTPALEELRDVIRLLASARSHVEVLGDFSEPERIVLETLATGRARDRTSICSESPSAQGVRARAAAMDHLFCANSEGHVDRAWLEALSHCDRLRWDRPCSVFLSAQASSAADLGMSALWRRFYALGDAGAKFIVAHRLAVSPSFARDFSRSMYLYWALGRTLPEAYCATMAKISDPSVHRIGAFIVWLGGETQ